MPTMLLVKKQQAAGTFARLSPPRPFARLPHFTHAPRTACVYWYLSDSTGSSFAARRAG